MWENRILTFRLIFVIKRSTNRCHRVCRFDSIICISNGSVFSMCQRHTTGGNQKYRLIDKIITVMFFMTHWKVWLISNDSIWHPKAHVIECSNQYTRIDHMQWHFTPFTVYRSPSGLVSEITSQLLINGLYDYYFDNKLWNNFLP